MQKYYRGRIGRAYLTVEQIRAVDRDGLVARRHHASSNLPPAANAHQLGSTFPGSLQHNAARAKSFHASRWYLETATARRTDVTRL